MINPLQLLQMIMGGKVANPQQMVMEMLEQNSNNPMFANLLNMAKNKDKAGIETVVRNYMSERGMNFDSEFSKFKQNFGIQQ